MKTCILYCRKSTNDKGNAARQANSLDVQISVLRDFARQNDCLVEKVFVESASGRDDNRQVFQQALAYARTQNTLILCYRLDRLSRSNSFYAHIKSDLHRFRIAQLGWREPDEFIVNLLLAVAANESKILGLRISQTIQHLKRNNPERKWGNPNIRTTAVPASLKVRKSNAREFNQKMASLLNELHEVGYATLQAKADRLNELGITTRRNASWSPSSVHRVLNYAA